MHPKGSIGRGLARLRGANVGTELPKRGFTLIEVLIAMLILTVAVLALADLFMLSMKKNAQSGELSRINQMAQQKLEELFSVDWDTMNANVGTELGTCETDTSPPIPAAQPNPCDCYCDDVYVTTGYNRMPSGPPMAVNQRYRRLWWYDPGAETNSVTLRVQVIGQDLGNSTTGPKGHIGKQQIASMSIIKAGPLGGAFTRN